MDKGRSSTFLTHVALFALATSVPLSNKLASSPEFYFAHTISTAGMWLWLFSLIAMPLIIPAFVFYLPLPNFIRRILISGFLSILLGAVFLMHLSPYIFGNGYAQIAFAAVLSLVTIAYLHRTERSISWIGRIFFVLLFIPLFDVFSVPALRHIALPQQASDDQSMGVGASTGVAPVVLILLDELPLNGLLRPDGTLDTVRFPNFSTLANTSSWYRNFTTVAFETETAVPALLSGHFPGPVMTSPSVEDHPDNIFSWLAASHHIFAREPITHLCSKHICDRFVGSVPTLAQQISTIYSDAAVVLAHQLTPDDLSAMLPTIDHNWGSFMRERVQKERRTRRYDDRLSQLISFPTKALQMAQAHPQQKPAFVFIHQLLPHIPYQYLPSMSTYGQIDKYPRGYVNEAWIDNEPVRREAYQRFIWQTQAVDAALGRIFDAMRQTGYFDQSLIIVTADHGVSFISQARRRSDAKLRNVFYDLMNVPLFIKTPFQKMGEINDMPLQSVDFLKLLAEKVNLTLPFASDSTYPNQTLEKRSIFVRFPAQDGQAGAGGWLAWRKANKVLTKIELPPNATGPDSTLAWKHWLYEEDKSTVLPCTNSKPSTFVRSISSPWQEFADGQFSFVLRNGGAIPSILRIRTAPAPEFKVFINDVYISNLSSLPVEDGENELSILIDERKFVLGKNILKVCVD